MAQVSIRQVHKVYDGGVQAVKGIDLEIADHEFVVLVGPSGCGKSTTLRMVAGLEEISDGDILIGERIVNDVPPRNRDIAMVFQNYALYPHLSVFDNMAFGLKLRKFSRDEIKRRVDEAARILDITSLLDRKPKALSGGQRQRVAARLCGTRWSSFSTSLCPIWTPSSAYRCGRKSSRCTKRSTRPPSTSRTTRSRR